MRPRLLRVAAAFAVLASAQEPQLPAPAPPATPAESTRPTSAELASEDPSVLRARMEVDRMRILVENGTVARARLEKAEQELVDKQDEALITRALYGRDITSEQAAETVAAAQRRLERRKKTFDDQTKQLAAGLISQQDMINTREDVERAQKDVDWAIARGKLVKQVESMAAAEADMMARLGTLSPFEARKFVERYDGKGTFTSDDRVKVEASFYLRFAHKLPVSADGGSVTHRAMGFDHRGRVDVPVNPDSQEGVWLRHYLTANRIPFFAFRTAIAHQATGAHIHMGPPSLRYVPGVSGF